MLKFRFRLSVVAALIVVTFEIAAAQERNVNDADELTQAAQLVWSQPGDFTGVAVDAKSNAYGIDSIGFCHVFDSAGKRVHRFPYAVGAKNRILTARGPAPHETYMVAVHETSVVAFSTKGKQLWASDGNHFWDACVADLDRDGIDEVIACYENYSGPGPRAGVIVFEHDGLEAWHNKTNGTRSVGVGQLDESPQLEVFCPSNLRENDFRNQYGGHVVAFTSDGITIGPVSAELRVGYHDCPVAVSLPNKKIDTLAGIAFEEFNLGGRKSTEAYFFALDDKRNFIWGKGDDLDFGYVNHACPGRPWVIVRVVDEEILKGKSRLGVLDVSTGKLVATIEDNHVWDSGRATWLAWQTVNANDPPLLLVAGSQNLTAYSIKP